MSYEEPTLTEYPLTYPKKASWWRRQPLFVRALAVPLVAGFAGMSVLLLTLQAVPLPDESLANPTEIDSADGDRLTEWTLSGSRSQRVTLKDIPHTLQQATLAVEDVNFYHHRAFNLTSIARALIVDVQHGHVVEGGSTITQQLAKNLYLSQDRTIGRKLKEALYAMQLELHESKNTILNQYLNVVYYGNGAYGIGSAAELYFGKSVNELNLAQSALLAGLPKGPSLYSPLLHLDAAKQRQHVVLERMVAAGFISQATADTAYSTPLHFTKHPAPLKVAPYFTQTAISEVERRFKVSADDLYKGNLSITTTLDPFLQKAAEHSIATTIPKSSGIQVSMVVLDPETGAIKAMVGGRDFDQSPYNRAFAERQPGSTFKGILYSAALSHGWTPAEQVNSALTSFEYGKQNERIYTVHDYGDYFANRPLTLREAIARSDNVYAVTTNEAVGPKNVITMARNMGVYSPLQPFPALALGVFPTSPLQMATAYATLANGGSRIVPYAVQELRDAAEGKVYQTDVQRTSVLSPQIAFQMTDLLTSVLQPHGTAYSVHGYLSQKAAAKTGTTNTDSWTVGYTPKLVCAVWVGYDNNKPLTLSESHYAAPIWGKFMGTAQQHVPSAWYKPPVGLVKATIDPLTAKLATSRCADTETDYYIAGTQPKDTCPVHPVKQSKHDEAQPKTPGLFQWFKKWFS